MAIFQRRARTDRSPTEKEKLQQSVHLGACFLFLFMAYGTTQNLLTSLLPDIGLYLLIILYGGFIISAFFGPMTVPLIGLRKSLVIPALVYTTFIGVLQSALPPLSVPVAAIYAVAILLCSSTGSFWQAQGNYLKRLTQDNKKTVGKHNGIFQAFYLGSNFIGNMTIALIFYFLKDATGTVPARVRVIAVWVLFGLALFAALMFVFLKPVPKMDGYVKESLKEKAKAVITAFKHRGMLVLLIYLHGIYAGFAFPFSGYSVNIPLSLVPWVFTAYGGATIIGSFSIGFLIDRFSSRVIFGIHLAVALVTYALVYVSVILKIVPLYFVVGGLFGIFDSISMTFSSSLIMKTLPPSIFSGAMSINRIIWGLAGVVIFLVQKFTIWYVTAGVVISIFTVGCIVAMIFIREPELEHAPLNPETASPTDSKEETNLGPAEESSAEKPASLESRSSSNEGRDIN